jgi:hypothetical protein
MQTKAIWTTIEKLPSTRITLPTFTLSRFILQVTNTCIPFPPTRVLNVEIGCLIQRRANPQVTLKATLELDLQMNDLYLPVAELADEELQQQLAALDVR